MASPTNTEILLSLNTLYFGQSFFVMLLNDVRSQFAFTVNTTTNTVTATGHDYVLNTPVNVVVSGGGTLPAPLVAGTTYYVRESAPNTFKLAATVDGDAIDLTTVGTGTFLVSDLVLSPSLNTVALYQRKEIDSYEGLGVRPVIAFTDAPAVSPTKISITKSIALNNVGGANGITFNKLLLIRGGSSAINSTSGTPAVFSELLADVVVQAGQADTLNFTISRPLV